MMVVGKDERPEIRSQFENDLVASLLKHQVQASPSYQQFSLDDLKGDHEQLRQKFADAKAESVLIVRLVERGSFVAGPPGTIGDITAGAVDESTYVRFTEGGGDIETKLRLGAKVYRVSDGGLVWSGMVDTVIKEDSDSIALLRSVAQGIVGRMARDKVIP
jgi:hypothetical protein